MSASTTPIPKVDDMRNGVVALREWLQGEVLAAVQPAITVCEDDTSSVSQKTTALFTTVQWSSEKCAVTQHHTRILHDSVFQPLAKYATCTKTIVSFLSALSAVLRAGVRSVFATVAVRDRILLPIAQHVATEEAAMFLVSILETLNTPPTRGQLFGTKSVRDRVFLPSVKLATTTESARMLVNALHCLFFEPTADGGAQMVSSSPCAAVFRTQAVRDRFFLPLVPLVTEYMTIGTFFLCLSNLVGDGTIGGEGALLFSTKAVRERIFVPLAKRVNNHQLAELFFQVASDMGVRGDNELFAGTAFRDSTIIPLAKHCTTPAAAATLMKLLCVIAQRSPLEVRARMHTTTMRDEVFIPLARLIVTHGESAVYLCAALAFAGGAQNNSGSNIFATPAVRDEIILPLSYVVPKPKIDLLFHAISLITLDAANITGKDVFATPAVRDAVFCELAHSTVSDDCTAHILQALLNLIVLDAYGARRRLFATAAVRDEVLVPLFKHACRPSADPSSRAALLLASIVDVLRATPSQPAALAPTDDSDEEISWFGDEVFLSFAEHVTTIDSAACLIRIVDRALWLLHAAARCDDHEEQPLT